MYWHGKAQEAEIRRTVQGFKSNARNVSLWPGFYGPGRNERTNRVVLGLLAAIKKQTGHSDIFYVFLNRVISS